MGALRIIGAAVLIAGIVGLVASIVFWLEYFAPPTMFGGLSGVGIFLALGILWGPVLIILGLVLLYVSARMREKAA